MAKLDGKRLSILVARGTYTKMYLDAYNLVNGKLVKVWRWFGDETDPPVRGQGSHGMHAADFDGDGKEEVLLGSVVVDDNGKTMWSNGMGIPMSAIQPTLSLAAGPRDRIRLRGS